MSGSDKMRAEFEEWAKLELFDPLCPDANYLERDETSYFHTVADNYWIAWQAAYAAGQKSEREAIFIEWENGEIMAAEVERLRAELRAAKFGRTSRKQKDKSPPAT